MATLTEALGLLGNFSPIFTFLLIFAIIYSVLERTELVDDNKSIQAIIATALALLAVTSETVTKLIQFTAPWFILAFIMILMLILIYRTVGVSEESIVNYIEKDRAINWVLIGIALTITMVGVFQVFGEWALQETAKNTTQTGFQQNLINTVFNSQMLGLLLVFGLAVFTIALLGGETT